MPGWVRGGRTCGNRPCNQQKTDFKHVFETDRSIRCNRFAQRIVGEDDFHPSRLTVIPFHWIVRPVRTDHAVPRGNLVPQQGAGRTRCADPGNIDGKSIGMERMEFVGKAADTECRWPVSREKIPANGSPAPLASVIAAASRLTNSGCSRPIARSGPCRVMV